MTNATLAVKKGIRIWNKHASLFAALSRRSVTLPALPCFVSFACVQFLCNLQLQLPQLLSHFLIQQPNEAGFVLLGDLTLDSSTDPDDAYQMVSCSSSALTGIYIASSLAGPTIAMRRRVWERQHCARREIEHQNAHQGREGEFMQLQMNQQHEWIDKSMFSTHINHSIGRLCTNFRVLLLPLLMRCDFCIVPIVDTAARLSCELSFLIVE